MAAPAQPRSSIRRRYPQEKSLGPIAIIECAHCTRLQRYRVLEQRMRGYQLPDDPMPAEDLRKDINIAVSRCSATQDDEPRCPIRFRGGWNESRFFAFPRCLVKCVCAISGTPPRSHYPQWGALCEREPRERPPGWGGRLKVAGDPTRNRLPPDTSSRKQTAPGRASRLAARLPRALCGRLFAFGVGVPESGDLLRRSAPGLEG